MPDKRYQRIYLSPHLDDAVLSCGGRIFQECQAGLSVLVLTLMAGDAPAEIMDAPFVTALHTRWELQAAPNPVAARRAEDRAALSVLGADGLYAEWLDCIYRRHAQTGAFLYHSEAALFGPVHPSELDCIGALARQLADLRLAKGGRVYAPLTVGGHVDHRLVRRAAEIWGPPEGELMYYEDFPYAEKPGALETILENDRDWQAEIVPLDEDALGAKVTAVDCYRSQISTFFSDTGEIKERLYAFARASSDDKRLAERYWNM